MDTHTYTLYTSPWIIVTSTHAHIKEESFQNDLKHLILLDYFNYAPWGLVFFCSWGDIALFASKSKTPIRQTDPDTTRPHLFPICSSSKTLPHTDAHTHTHTSSTVFFRGSQLRIQRLHLRFTACSLVGDILIMCSWQKQSTKTQLMCYPAIGYVAKLM